MKLHEKYLITENKTYKMKEFLKHYDVTQRGQRLIVTNKKIRADKMIFNSYEEFIKWVEDEYSFPIGGRQR